MTYCIALEEEIVVATCPLKKGTCYWQHRQTNLCMSTSDELTLTEYCKRVGTDIPLASDLDLIKTGLRSALNKGRNA